MVVNDCRTDGEGEATAEAIRAAGGEAIYVAADVAREDDVKRLVKTAVDTFGRLDVMVNNAGVMVVKPLAELTEEDFDRVTSVNQAVEDRRFCTSACKASRFKPLSKTRACFSKLSLSSSFRPNTPYPS